jgi:hypothetical protein
MAGSLALAVLTEASLQPHAHVPHGIRITRYSHGTGVGSLGYR